MNSRDDLYSKEADLINRSKRELANGLDKDPIYKLRLTCFTRGATGVLLVSKAFRHMEKTALTFEEFKNVMQQTKLGCTADEIRTIFDDLDTVKSGIINANEFLAKLMPPVARPRLAMIHKAFAKIDCSGEGVVTAKALKANYNVKDHPKYLSGELTEKELMQDFLSNFEDSNGQLSSKVSKEEFENYYATLSASIDNDAYFDLLMRRAYKL